MPSPPLIRKLPFHYGWMVVILGSITTTVSITILMAFAIFLEPISRDTGWSRGTVAGASAANWAMGALSVIAIGWMVDRFGTRRTMLLGAIVTTISLLLTARSQSLWQFYLNYGILYGLARSAFLTPVHVVVGIWFRKRLGVALGIVNAVGGAGPFFMAPFISSLVANIGWRGAFLAMAIVGGLILIAGSWFIRNAPADVGQQPYGETDVEVATKATPLHQPIFYRQDVPNFFRYAVTTQPFVWLILIHLLGCVSHNVPLTHMVAMAIDKGITPLMAATFFGLVSGFGIVSRFGMSVLSDWIGGKKAMALTLALQTVGLVLLLGKGEPWQFYVFSFLMGIGSGGEMAVFPVINRQYYGSAPIGTIYGYQMMGAGMGMALGAYAGGFFYDLMGNYTAAIWFSLLMGALSVGAALRLVSPVPRKVSAS